MPLRSKLSCLAVLAVALGTGATAQAAPYMDMAVQDDAVLLNRLYGSQTKTLGLASELKVNRIRVNVSWSYVVGKKAARSRKTPKRIRYNWTGFDALYKRAKARGMKLQLVLTGPAPAYATGNHKKGPNRPKPKAFKAFASAAAKHFKGRIDRYSIWNEPNYVGWISPLSAGPAIYRALYITGYNAIKKADPGAAVLIGETSPFALRKRATAPLKFLRGVVSKGGLVADGYAHHPYEFKHAPNYKYKGADNVTIGTLSRLTKALDKLAKTRSLATRKRKAPGVFLTEFGYFASGERATTEANRAMWLPQAFAIAQKNKRVRQMLHYGLVAPPSTQSGAAFDFGLLLIDGSQRPAYEPLVKWSVKAVKKKRIARPGGAIALPAAQAEADPPGEPPPPEPEPCTLPVFGFPCP